MQNEILPSGGFNFRNKLSTPEGYAGIWIRSFALIIDVVIFFPFGIFLETLIEETITENAVLNHYVLYNIIFTIIAVVYYVTMTASKFQGTLGQMIMRIKVTDLNKQRISLKSAFKRYIIWIVPALPMMIMMFTPGQIELESKGKICEELQNDAEAFLNCMNEIGYFENAPYMFGTLGIAILGGIIIAATIAFNKEKAGIHDRICKQRVYLKEKGTTS